MFYAKCIPLNCSLSSMKIKTILNLSLARVFSVSQNTFNSSSPVSLSYNLYKPDVEPVSTVPLIILHGFLGSKLNWRSLGKAISRKTERLVYTLDARNHGDSPHTDDFSISLMSADLRHFMDKENIPNAILIGHSLGGRAAIHFTITNKESTNKLVVVDISPNTLPVNSTLSPTYMHIMKEAIETVGNMNLNKTRNAIDKHMSQKIPEAPIRQFLLTNLTQKNGEIVWKPNIDSLLKNYESGVLEMPQLNGHYMGDTLFICGEESPFVKEEDEPKIKALFPKAEILRIKGAGHWVHSDRPTEFIQSLCDFIN